VLVEGDDISPALAMVLPLFFSLEPIQLISEPKYDKSFFCFTALKVLPFTQF
jgi:hypothetical protein